MDRFQKRRQTKLKRKSQICKIFELKIDSSKLSNNTKELLFSLFRETKWFYNYCLSFKDVNDADTTAKSVPVKIKDQYEDRTFTVLSGAMKQAIKTRLFGSIKSLSELKKKGHKVGWLKFKSCVSSVGLQQYKKTHFLDFQNNRIRIQNIKQWLRVSGMEQITPDLEIANAHLIKRATGFYLNVTTFQEKLPASVEAQHQPDVPEQSTGIDFGCETQLTFSNGIKVEFQVPVSKRIKQLDRRINKKVNGKIGRNRASKNRRKLQWKRRKAYERLTNKKKDIRNKLVNAIKNNYKYVCFQDENIKGWQAGGHGKKVQFSGVGGIIADLKHKSHTPIEVDKFFPSTQICPMCSKNTKHERHQRVYECSFCGFRADRDVKAAQMIEIEGLRIASEAGIKIKIPMDCRDFACKTSSKPGENCSSVFFSILEAIPGIKVSKNGSVSQEATGLAPS